MSKTISPKTATSTEKPTRTVQIITAEASVPTYYANNTAVETTVWDIRLKFAETLENDRESNITKVRELAYVRMSPQHARVIAGILNTHLEHYEAQYGRIPKTASEPATETRSSEKTART
jgi:hypothetical protein